MEIFDRVDFRRVIQEGKERMMTFLATPVHLGKTKGNTRGTGGDLTTSIPFEIRPFLKTQIRYLKKYLRHMIPHFH